MSMKPEKSKEEVRRILWKAHGFQSLSKGCEGVMQFFQRQPCVQVDSIDVAGCNQDLTLFSRVENYRRHHLENLLYEKRELFEYFCKMMSILPLDKYPLFKCKMNRRHEQYNSFFDKYKSEIAVIMKTVEKGPICSRDLKDMGKIEWGWGQIANAANTLLTRLWVSGEVMVHHRQRRTRYYALPDTIIPEKYLNMPAPNKEDALVEIADLIVRASRLVSPSKAPEQWNEIGKVRDVRHVLNTLAEEGRISTVKVEGWRGDLYYPTEDQPLWDDLAEIANSNARFLAPLDPLLWNRSLFETIYGHEYVWEVYKKKEDRIYGYYCLPILYDGDYVGLIEPRFRGEDKTLEVRSLHLFNDISEDAAFSEAFGEELERFMEYLGADTLEDKSQNKWFGRQI
ncbi:winged helix-turn-helix domain-containing protein [Candidatus Thorarchaeota archaeon]|nr:MAG: winged helix-turn-helix domain-containing protein [Candidatus Thorarchaeota archaeon]